MFDTGDLVCIEKNRLRYKRGEKEFISIPAGVYEVMEGNFDTKRNEGPIFTLKLVGGINEPIIVDWKSLQYNTKWRKL